MENISSNNNPNFYWWFGVVEDRDDPLRIGRCRVRILGYHNDDTEILPTTDLPWAVPIGPTTSAGTSGVGWSPTGPVPGSWVVGFFADGESGQHPMFFGTVGSVPGGLGANGNCEPGYGPGNSGDPTGNGGGDGGQPIQGGPPNQEFWTLVAICACEAGPSRARSQDQADVAQSIYNRANSGSYGSRSVLGIILARGQYEPTWRWPSAGTNGVPNAAWRNITDVNSAARASNISARDLMHVAAALKDSGYQTSAREFIGARTDFLGIGQPARAMTANGSKVQRTSRSNQFGFSANYRGAGGTAGVPSFVTNYQLGDGSPVPTTTPTPNPGS